MGVLEMLKKKNYPLHPNNVWGLFQKREKGNMDLKGSGFAWQMQEILQHSVAQHYLKLPFFFFLGKRKETNSA